MQGRLDTRADATRHEGDFRKIVEGVNDTLDAVIGPLNVAAEYVERISRGDIPERSPTPTTVTSTRSRITSITVSMVCRVLSSATMCCTAWPVNDHSKGVEGEYVGIFASMGKSTNEVRDRLLSVTKLMNEIAVGDTSRARRVQENWQTE